VSAGAIAVLVGAGAIGPARLRRLFAHHTPDDAVERLRSGARLHPMVLNGLRPETLGRLRERVRATSVTDAAGECDRLGVQVVALDDPRYPAVLVHDPEAPVALFVRGDLDVLADRRVGIVGTRHASAAGRATASELGAALSASSVAVISGLARGIDAAAHRGIRAEPGPGRPVAVVGSGPDVHYPKPNADLWEWVAETGLLISEWPPGVAPDAWRFPQRNRILAALSEVVVVVESRERGGSLITARAAADRGIEVMAVPGSPRSRASAGTNQLLVDGVAPLTCVDDVLVALGLDHRRQGTQPFDPRRPPDALQRRVLQTCELEPCNLDMIVASTGLSITEAALGAARLERSGWLAESGGWFEPVGSRLTDR
jgi:DNA processing protein